MLGGKIVLLILIMRNIPTEYGAKTTGGGQNIIFNIE